jgi:saccharopine dehydrogenase-like NADP-dependent oxidoreductase
MAVLGGAGAMGRAAVFDLARAGVHVRLVEADRAAAEAVARRYGRGRVEVARADAGDPAALARRLRGLAVLVNCAPYRLNLGVMEAALRANCHYVDLGGLFHTTRRQLALDGRFRRAGLLAVLGMGSAPGIVNVLARAAADRMRRVKSVRVYNGGADFTRYRSPLALPFSPATILDELTQAPMVFRAGRFHALPPLSGAEPFRFDLGRQVVRHSLHSEVATLPLSFRDKGLRECSFKIAYDPVVLDRLRLLVDLGLADPRPGPHGVAPRDVLLERLRRLPPPPDFVDDRDALSVIVEGADARGALTVRFDLTATPQRDPPLSAVARHTGFPPAIVARMIAGGGIPERGVLPPERCVPVAPFLAALAERGLRARVRRTRTKGRYSGRSKR